MLPFVGAFGLLDDDPGFFFQLLLVLVREDVQVLFGAPAARARVEEDLHIVAHEDEEQLEEEARIVVQEAESVHKGEH